MTRHSGIGSQPADEAVGAPADCPACHSGDVMTASKVINASTYWRCGACGEVWNVARLRQGSRYAGYRPYGR
ncbi:MAG TPA: hypothetical protein VLD67_00920 [Vicinamibacterales bacterium]|nr:hypothetical protein [Vicinamibacterales bacterium]